MRRLAAELGVLPNALYSHVANKQALTDALVDALLGDVRPPDGDGWRQRLDGLVHATRDALRREPALAAMYLQRAGRGPNAIRLAELAADLLREAGLEPERVAEAFRILLAHTVGFVVFETARAAGGGQHRPLPPGTDLDSRLATPTSDQDFDLGLTWLLDGIASRPTGDPHTGAGNGQRRP
jgi:AcrR family transcriptional regulator